MRTGKARAGLRLCFYGAEAVGKSSLAAAAPAPIFIDLEDGTGNLDVARYSFRDGPAGHIPGSFSEVLGAIRDLRNHDHPYRTLVIDTIDRLEPLIWASCIARDSGKRSGLNAGGAKLHSIESYGYGKGFQVALDEWRGLAVALDDLRTLRGMHVVLLGHAIIRTFKNPEGEDFDRYHLRINEKAAGFIKEWCDVVGFCAFEEVAGRLDESDTRSRAKGASTGRRVMRLQRTAAYDAKSRIAMPAVVELAPADPWRPFSDAIRAGLEEDATRAVAEIERELERIGDAGLAAKVRGAVEENREDAARLARFLTDLRQRQPKSKEETSNG